MIVGDRAPGIANGFQMRDLTRRWRGGMRLRQWHERRQQELKRKQRRGTQARADSSGSWSLQALPSAARFDGPMISHRERVRTQAYTQ
jgi:hypothetical protein